MKHRRSSWFRRDKKQAHIVSSKDLLTGEVTQPQADVEVEAPLDLGAEADLETVLAAYHRSVADRIEKGLRDIQESAVSLMHEIAGEVWKTSDADAKDIQERILSVLARDAAIRGLIAHSDERFQALDIRVAGVQETVDTVNQITQDLRTLLDRPVEGLPSDTVNQITQDLQTLLDRTVEGLPAQAVIEGMDTEAVDRVRTRIEKLQQYLGSVVEYQGQRDQAIADWLQKTLGQAQQLIRDEAERVIADLAAELDRVTEDAEGRFQERIEEQSRSLAYTLSVQEARIRISLMEGQSEQADALGKQLESLEELEKDLTIAFDERMARLAEIIASATIWSVEEIAGRVRKESQKAFQEGIEDLVSILDRRFVWLEQSIDERLKKLERVTGQTTTRIPEAEEKPAPRGRSGELPLPLEDEIRARF
jgi:hypothetical protein